MIENIKSVLIGLTKEFGPDETSSALAYGLSMAQQAGAHATVQAASVKLDLSSAGISKVVAGLVQEENQRLHALAEAAARSAQGDASAAGVVWSAAAPHLSYPALLAVFKAQARLHDLTVTVQTLPALEGDVAEALRNHATLTHADMIVMGGYVHSRLREMVFGGVTSSLLKQCPVALLLSY